MLLSNNQLLSYFGNRHNFNSTASITENSDSKVTNKDALEILRYTIQMSKNDKIGYHIE